MKKVETSSIRVPTVLLDIYLRYFNSFQNFEYNQIVHICIQEKET